MSSATKTRISSPTCSVEKNWTNSMRSSKLRANIEPTMQYLKGTGGLLCKIPSCKPTGFAPQGLLRAGKDKFHNDIQSEKSIPYSNNTTSEIA
jgi:hypothetical protein